MREDVIWIIVRILININGSVFHESVGPYNGQAGTAYFDAGS